MADVLNDPLVDFMALASLGADPVPPTLRLILYVNNLAAYTHATILADLTECTAPGYAGVDLNPVNWTGGVVAGVADYLYPPITFTMTGPGGPAQTVYGQAVVNTADGVLWWGSKWTTPFAIPSGGGAVQVSLFWEDKVCS